jgi:trehalose-phosphatase
VGSTLDRIIEDFLSQTAGNDYGLLMLDYDGTLAPFRRERDKAFPYDGVKERLEKLVSLEKSRVVIISGRAIEHLKPLLNMKKLPEIYGSHGWERLSADGQYSLRKAEKNQLELLNLVTKYIIENGWNEYLEIKPVSIAIHFRGVENDKMVDIKKRILHHWEGLTRQSSSICSEFDGGMELKPPGFNKGDVVKNIISDYRSGSAIAYLGDDLTDEDAFGALPDNTLGILVSQRAKETLARARINPPEELLIFLDRWISNYG